MNIKRSILSLFVAGFVVLITTQSALAGVILKTDSIVSADVITVGDVFEGAGPYAGRFLAPFPPDSSGITLTARDLKRISDAFNLNWQPVGETSSLLIRHNIHKVDRYAIQAAVQASLTAQMDGQRFDMSLPNKNLSMTLPPDAPQTVEAKSVRIDLRNYSFTALLSAPAGADKPIYKEISGQIYPLVSIPVLKNTVRKGDVIEAENMDAMDMRVKDVPPSILTSAESIVGRVSRRTLPSLRPIFATDVDEKVLVKKGELVTVALRSGPLGLTLQARALEDGTHGEVVRLVNPSSNRTIQGVVIGAQTVELRLPTKTVQ